MIKKRFPLFTLLLMMLSNTSFSMILNTGDRVTINSTTLNEQREVQILLPENYHSNPKATYPVIYLLDGDYVFQGVSGMLDFLANKAQLIPDVIVVAIADKGTEKYRQYMTPAELTAPFKKENKGKAKSFLNFLTEELQPYIKSHYRAANNTVLVGHSIGGLFVLNTLLESPSSFNHFVSISPSVWLNEHGIMVKAKEVVASSKHKPTSLYLSLGDETRQGVYGLLQLLDEKQPKHIQWSYSHYPDENHNSVVLIALRGDLKNIFKNWFISDSELSRTTSANELIEYYQQLSSTLSINQPIPMPAIKSAIRSFYRQEKTKELPAFMAKVAKVLPTSEQAFIIMQASYVGHFDSPKSALALLKHSEKRFNHSIAYLKSIAGTHEQLGDTDLAISYYAKALTLAKQYKSNQWEINILEAKLLKNSK